MMNVQVRALDERDVLALYRRYPGTPGPLRCLLSLDLADGSFSAGPDEEPGDRVAGTFRQGPVLHWAIPCLTAEAANEVLAELAPLARLVLAGAVTGWQAGGGGIWAGRDRGGVLDETAAAAADRIASHCQDIAARAENVHDDMYDEVVREKDAPGWFAEEDPAAEYGITAETTDLQLSALAISLERGWASPAARPVVVVRGVLEYMTGVRDSLRAPVSR